MKNITRTFIFAGIAAGSMAMENPKVLSDSQWFEIAKKAGTCIEQTWCKACNTGIPTSWEFEGRVASSPFSNEHRCKVFEQAMVYKSYNIWGVLKEDTDRQNILIESLLFKKHSDDSLFMTQSCLLDPAALPCQFPQIDFAENFRANCLQTLEADTQIDIQWEADFQLPHFNMGNFLAFLDTDETPSIPRRDEKPNQQ
jgi:hypothetical protein